MANFPFFSLPYNNYYNYYSRYNNYLKSNTNNKETENIETRENIKINEDKPTLENNTQTLADELKHENRSSKYSYSGPVRFNFDFFSDSEKPIIEIMGIKLYLDDLIILGLLFFLYQEGVKDEMLFIVLILLLLT